MQDAQDTSVPSWESAIPSAGWQAAVGGLVVLLGIGMGIGASMIEGDAGYGGVGPNFLPWVCAVALTLCGLWLVGEAWTGGYRQAAEPGGSARADIGSFVWVSAGLLLNAALIEQLGFVFSCALCYLLAVQGLRRAHRQQQVLGVRRLALDVVTGLVIAAPVYWTFTQLLAINLPGLTNTGWL